MYVARATTKDPGPGLHMSCGGGHAICSRTKEMTYVCGVWACSHAREMVLLSALFAWALAMAVSLSAPTAGIGLYHQKHGQARVVPDELRVW